MIYFCSCVCPCVYDTHVYWGRGGPSEARRGFCIPPELKVCEVVSHPARFLGRKPRYSEKAGSWAILTIELSLCSLFMHIWECSVSVQPECREMDRRADFPGLSFERELGPSGLCVWTLSVWLAEPFGNVALFGTGGLAGGNRDMGLALRITDQLPVSASWPRETNRQLHTPTTADRIWFRHCTFPTMMAWIP